MIERNLAEYLRELSKMYPVVTVTGPRQSGKTTLCKALFADKPYVSLEPLDVRAFATEDPRGFLDSYPDGAVIDEVQHVPGLLSYLQGVVDADPRPGRFILTGSQHFGLAEAVAQSLAGRTGVLSLLPLSYDEVQRFAEAPTDLWTTLWTGGYPRILDRRIPPDRWLADYVTTYVQRDVRQVLQIGDLLAFTTFVRLCAGRTGQELNLSALGADAGISHHTAKAWLSVLEAGFLVHRLPAWHTNLTSRMVKAPKLHFIDSGLACHLLGIRDPDQLRYHPLRGAIFETWAVAEVMKARVHRGLAPSLYHLRQPRGGEIDLLVEAGRAVILLEAKSGATVPSDALAALGKLAMTLRNKTSWEQVDVRLVYGGDTAQQRTAASVIPWSALPTVDWD